jgi:hypothetical protein
MPKISFDQNFRLTKTVEYGSLWLEHLNLCNLEELRAILEFLEARKPIEDNMPFLKLLIPMVQRKINRIEDEFERSYLEIERLKDEFEEHGELGKHGEIIDVSVDEDEDMEEHYRIAMENAG